MAEVDSKNALCRDCQKLWTIIGDPSCTFWSTCMTTEQLQHKTWSCIQERKYGQILEASGQCNFCGLVVAGLRDACSEDMPHDRWLFYSQQPFRDSEVANLEPEDVTSHGQVWPNRKRHLVHRLLISDINWWNEAPRELITLPSNRGLECHIMLNMDGTDAEMSSHLARSTGDTFDITLISSWINRCEEFHSAKCSPSTESPNELPKRVINVKKGCLESTPRGCKYIALSYRWPPSYSDSILTSVTEAKWMVPGGLEADRHAFPRVIRDSIRLVKNLCKHNSDYKYLWIDALCVRQDEVSKEEQKQQMNAMMQFYEGAVLTVVALTSGGLHRVRPSKYHAQRTAKVGGLAFSVSKEDLPSAVDQSPWKKRAWTFQEAAVSRRLVIFLHDLVFFQCRTSHYQEDVWEGPEQWESKDHDLQHHRAAIWRPSTIGKDMPFFPDYTEGAMDLSGREIGRQEDTHKAARVLNPSNQYCNLHEENLPRSLCFLAKDATWNDITLHHQPFWCLCNNKSPHGIQLWLHDGHPGDFVFFPHARVEKVGGPICVHEDGTEPTSPRFLKLQAALIVAQLQGKVVPSDTNCNLYEFESKLGDAAFTGHAWLNADCGYSEGRHVGLLLMGTEVGIGHETGRYILCFLVIGSVGGLEDAYCRIGSAAVEGGEIQCPLTDVWLV